MSLELGVDEVPGELVPPQSRPGHLENGVPSVGLQVQLFGYSEVLSWHEGVQLAMGTVQLVVSSLIHFFINGQQYRSPVHCELYKQLPHIGIDLLAMQLLVLVVLVACKRLLELVLLEVVITLSRDFTKLVVAVLVSEDCFEQALLRMKKTMMEKILNLLSIRVHNS